MTISTDRSFFTVIAQLSNGEITQPEMDIELSREMVLEMARNGQFDKVLHIFESNPLEGWCNDITADLEDSEVEEARFVSTPRNQMRHDPNHEHRIGNFEAGTGSYGRAA